MCKSLQLNVFYGMFVFPVKLLRHYGLMPTEEIRHNLCLHCVDFVGTMQHEFLSIRVISECRATEGLY